MIRRAKARKKGLRALSERKLQITGAAISPIKGCTGAPIIEVLRGAGPFDGFRRLPGNAQKATGQNRKRIASCAPRRPILLSDMFTPAAWRHRDLARLTVKRTSRRHRERLPQRETMAKYCDGIALDRRDILEAAKEFRRLKAHKHLPALRAALAVHQSKCVSKRVEDNADVA